MWAQPQLAEVARRGNATTICHGEFLVNLEDKPEQLPSNHNWLTAGSDIRSKDFAEAPNRV
jgi:hypothetical protein